MRIRNHRPSSSSTCISNGRGSDSFQALTMVYPQAHAFPLAKTCAETSTAFENLHHQQWPQTCSEAVSIFDVAKSSLDKTKADVRCSNRVVAVSELQKVLPPIPASKPLLSNDDTATTMGIQAMEKEPIEKFRVCTVNMSPWDVPSFVGAFERDSTPSHEHDNNQKRKCRMTVVQKKRHSNAKHCWKPNKPANTTVELNKLKTLRSLERLETIEAQTNFRGKDKFAKLDAEEVMIESALKNVLSECDGGGLGLTVRQAACRVLLFHKYNPNCNNSDKNRNNNNRNVCGGLPLSVVVRRVMLNSPYFVELNHGRFALWDDFIKRRAFPDDINSQKLNVDREEKSCNEHEKDEMKKGVASQSPCLDNKIKQKRSSRKLGSTREEYKNMELIPQKTDITMKHSTVDECRQVDQKKDPKTKSDEDSSDCKRTSENGIPKLKRKSPPFLREEKWVNDNECLWLTACDGERNRDSRQQSCSQKNKKRKAMKARSLKALVESF